jgi:hypothetical protein
MSSRRWGSKERYPQVCRAESSLCARSNFAIKSGEDWWRPAASTPGWNPDNAQVPVIAFHTSQCSPLLSALYFYLFNRFNLETSQVWSICHQCNGFDCIYVQLPVLWTQEMESHSDHSSLNQDHFRSPLKPQQLWRAPKPFLILLIFSLIHFSRSVINRQTAFA